jgi:transcriptional regulator with XRE-family HTH domain
VPDDTTIGGRLRQARAEARITQAGAAAALGVPRSAVSALETGARHLTAVELAKCAALYRRPAGWFLGDDSGPAQPMPELGCLIAALPRADQDTVSRFAEFLAARQAAATRAPNVQLTDTPSKD